MENQVAAVEKRKFVNRKALIITAVVLLLALVVGININKAKNKGLVNVHTATVKQQRLVETVLASGKVNVPDKEVIYSEATGSVKKINVKMGQKVQPGQVLMEIDIPNAEAKILQAQATLADAQSRLAAVTPDGKSSSLVDAQAAFDRADSEYKLVQDKLKRTQALFSAGAISQSDMETAQAEFDTKQSEYQRTQAALDIARSGNSSSVQALRTLVEAARASLELAEREGGQRTLTSAAGGTVLSIAVQKGDWITPNQALLTLTGSNTQEVRTDIAEADTGKIKVGQKAVISSSAMPEETFNGQVSEVGLEAVNRVKNQGETTVIPIVVSVQPNSRLRSGYNVDLKITTAVEDKARVVPYEALVDKQGHSCVYVIRNGKACLQRVTTGISGSESIQITSGLKPGEKVVINPSAELKDGSEVKI